MVCAAVLHLAFPRTGWWPLAPFALAGIFASWWRLGVRAAALCGFASGLVFFACGFAWFAETAGSLVGPAWPLLVLVPAAIEALAWSAAALVIALLAHRADTRVVPVATAAAFALIEWLRSSGEFGVPFSQLGVAMIDSPLRPIAAFAGGYGMTFVTAWAGAIFGWWLSALRDRMRVRVAAGSFAALLVLVGGAWLAWPARAYPAPQRTVAAVQGGIKQTIKHSDAGEALAIDRYFALTASLAAQHPALVLWPETVFPPYLGDRRNGIDARLSALSRQLGATLYAGTVSLPPMIGGEGNVLAIYDPAAPQHAFDSTRSGLYVKTQLVPFVEFIPGPAWLRSLPGAGLVPNFIGNPVAPQATVYRGASPLICWESVFGDIAQQRVAAGAQLLLIATDDAWFGTTQGPYEHAQAATLRAVESGRWVLRAAATGVSGVIAPDGTWTARTDVSDVPQVAVANVGAPVDVPYGRLGPLPFAVAFAVVTVLALAMRRP